jgi:hypothetical protein
MNNSENIDIEKIKKEKIKEYKRQEYLKNKEKIKAKSREYYYKKKKELGIPDKKNKNKITIIHYDKVDEEDQKKFWVSFD